MLEDRKEGFTTTFWMGFTIADHFGKEAVQDTFDRAFAEWKDDYLYLTDLVAVLNHKLWQHYGRGDEDMARLYDKLWRKADAYGYEHLKGDELVYFWKVLD